MAFDPGFGTSDIRFVRRATAAASLLLALSLLAGCGSSNPQPVVTGSTTTCVPMGSTISCSCTPITATHGS